MDREAFVLLTTMLQLFGAVPIGLVAGTVGAQRDYSFLKTMGVLFLPAILLWSGMWSALRVLS